MREAILMTGGGTGGHLAIIKALKEELQGERLIYVGSTRGQDRAWFGEDSDFEHSYFLESRGVVNQGFLGKFVSLFKILLASWHVRSIIKEHRVKVVFSVGGFSSAPAVFASKLTRTPLVIHEQNASIGSLNRLFKPLAHTFISSYEPSSPIKEYPIKKIFFQKAFVRKRVKTILFLGGSQGAKGINELALSLAPRLKAQGIEILHQAGTVHHEAIKRAYEALGVAVELYGFVDDMPSLMERADIAIARAGASTLWELSASGIPTLYIPYPYASGDHQYHNAQFLVKKRLAWVMREEQMELERVMEIVQEDLSSVSRGLMEQVQSGGSAKIAGVLRAV
jgi:UDP-N-acetylglucosamine--N-acetylmuramyl-(pentapeptide) pyrophosphoryl-undecaprenol N-acetylglucosamine transferase